MITTIVKKGAYFDSVKLMLVTQQIKNMPDIIEVGVVMGTDLNKDILSRVNLLSDEARNSSPADLIIAINASTQAAIDSVLGQIDTLLNSSSSNGSTVEYKPKSLEGALNVQPDANLAIISTPGHFAGIEVRKALSRGLHVMLFSDNMPVEEERALKEEARSKSLLVMGPDCGTSIINGVPLCFANKIRRGDIGVVGASGTGVQEVTTLIHKQGSGISHAIGTGGRDLSAGVGGITMLQGIDALNADPATKVIVLISKPPAKEIADRILSHIATTVKKPVVINFLGGEPKEDQPGQLEYASTLEEAAHKALRLSLKRDISPLMDDAKMADIIAHSRQKLSGSKGFIRGLFSGGTLNYEAILVLEELVGDIRSNTPVNKKMKLENSYELEGNASLDLGDDEFTVGRAHPMIDPTLRYKMLEEQLQASDVSIILLDVVLGYGAHEDPASGIAEIMKRNAASLQNKVVLASICGTDEDPQNYHNTLTSLENAGIIVAPSNRCAATIAGKIYMK